MLRRSNLIVGFTVGLVGWAFNLNAQQPDSLWQKTKSETIASNATITWQNGKLILPKANNKAISGNATQLLDTLRGNRGGWLDSIQGGKLSDIQNKSLAGKLGKSRFDSLGGNEWLSKGEDWSKRYGALAKNPNDLIKGEIYSDKKVKAIFDSLGIGRLDSVMAFASLKSEMSEADLLSRLNGSFGMDDKIKDREKLAALTNTKLSPESLSTLAPLSGMHVQPEKWKDPRFLMSKLAKKMDSLKLSHDALSNQEWTRQLSLKQLELGNAKTKADSILRIGKEQDWPKHKRDSILELQNRVVRKLDSLGNVQQKADSLIQNYERLKSEWTNKLSSKHKPELPDFLKSGNEHFETKEGKVSEDIKSVVVSQKSKFFSPIYFEGLASTVRSVKGQQEFYLSPGFGYEIKGGFSVGASPNVVIRPQEGKVDLLVGYRLFSKYRIIKELGYLQVEDVANPSDNIARKLTHRVLAGGGGLVPISKKVAINISLLYQVNKGAETQNSSNWVFRVGISTISEAKLKGN